MNNTEETQEPQVEEIKEGPTTEVPKVTLLSSISYINPEDYEAFLTNLSPEHAVVVLIAAANHSQARGIFSLQESELIAKAIKRLGKKPAEQPTDTTTETPNND